MIKIVIADDHTLFAKGLASILEENPNFKVTAIFNDGRSMVDYLRNQKTDIAIIDLNMPQFDGKSTLEKLNKYKKIRTKRIILSMYGEETLLRECFQLKIDAYLLKDTEPEILKNTIIEVHENRHEFSLAQLLENSNQIEKNAFDDNFIKKHKLSKREIEIINLIVKGLTNAKIAEKLMLSHYTIDTHRKNILLKLGVKNTAELVRFALDNSIK